MLVEDAARHSDGTVAICGYAADRDGRLGNFLALVSPDGHATRVIRTDPYAPQMVTFAPDGTIWAQGFVPTPRGGKDPDTGIVRHFDGSGKLLGSFLPQSSVPGGTPGAGYNTVAASSNRIGWHQGPQYGYFEVSFDGKLQQYAPVPACAAGARASTFGGLAVTGSGDVFMSRDCLSENHKAELFKLDRTQNTWKPVQLPDGVRPALLGGYGDTLVLHGGEKSSLLFLRANQVTP
jgi:hypothetical protein